MISELIVLRHLTSCLKVPVAFEVSEDLKDSKSYVIIQRIGGSVDDHIHSVSFALQSVAGSLMEACLLNEEVKKAMESLIESPDVSKIVLDSDYEYIDTATKRYRYQAVYDMWLFS